MKLLYLSCHSILEYDELKIFEELGIEYFSLGSYIKPQYPVDPIRPPLNRIQDPELYSIAPVRENMPKSFIDNFDVIVIMGLPHKEWISNNWDNMKHKRVIWRTIGQSTKEHEEFVAPYRKEGMQIIRYSPREEKIPGYAGMDALIRFYKDEKEFCGWNGRDLEVITFAQNMKVRSEHCNYQIFEKFATGLNAHVYGPKNDDAGPLNGGFMTYDEMKQKMRDARVYFYTGTQPASYTLNFIEAMMTGIPIVAIGPRLGTSLNINGDVYEIPDIIRSGVNGYWSDDVDTLKNYTQMLFKDHEMAKQIGDAGRKIAVSYFGKENIKNRWKNFLRI